MIGLLCISTIVFLTNGQPKVMNMDDYEWYYEARAYFHRYAMGEVSIINGNIEIDLDVTKVRGLLGNITMGLPSDCFDNGVYFHIHDNWDQETDMDYVGRDMCDEDDQTGDHFDPWFACSTESGGNDCNYNGGCIRPSSILGDKAGVKYRCNKSIYDEYPYACEIGDYSKYDDLIRISGSNKISKSYSSLWELNGLDIEDGEYNVVFHCANDDKTPAFCAPFNVTNRTRMGKIDSHNQGDGHVSVNFDGLMIDDANYYNDINIKIGEGWIQYKLPHEMADYCPMWSAYIMDMWDMDSNKAQINDMCNWTYVGGVYDPTYSCITSPYKESGNMHCEDGNRCPDDTNTAVDYECDNWSNALKCAAGHLTGRTGYINMTYHMMKNKDYDMTFEDRVSTPLRSLVGKSVLLYCENMMDMDGDDGMMDEMMYPMQLCAPITSSSLNLSVEEETGLTTGGSIAIVLLLLMGIGIGSAFYYSKKKNNTKSSSINNKESKEKFAVIDDDLSPLPDDNINDHDMLQPQQQQQQPPPPPPLATGSNNNENDYIPPKQQEIQNNQYDDDYHDDENDNESAVLAAPATTNDENIAIGTMNEGGGFMDNNNVDDDNDYELPPPVPPPPPQHAVNNDNDYQHVDIDDNE